MSKALNELKKATMAAYLAKAGGVLRADTKIGIDFENDAYRDLKTVNRHSEYNMDGKEKDPVIRAKAEKSMKTNTELAQQFKRGAKNRIKGIATAGRLLAKEQAEQIDELKKSTLGSYLKKAANRHGETAANIGALAGAAAVVAPGATLSQDELEDHLGKKAMRQSVTGAKGMGRAINRLTKEDAVNEAGKNPYGPGYKLVDKDGKQLSVGHKFKDEDGEHHEVTGWQSGAQRGNSSSSGRVAVKVGKGKNAYHTEYFPHVFDMKVVKEEVVNEADKADRKSTMALARHWRDHLTHIGLADYYSHEGERKGRDPKPHEKKAANVEKKVAAKWGKSAAKDMATHNWDVVLKDGMAQSSVRGPIELRKKHNIARHWAGNNEGSLTEGTDEINEVSKSTLASVATKRFAQAQAALKAGDFGGYVKGMNKSHKAADKTVPKSGWSPEDDGDTGVFGGPLPHKNLSKGQQAALDKILPKREEVSAQEKYRQIKEGMFRMGTRMIVKDDSGNKIGHVQRDSSPGRWRGYHSKSKEYTYHNTKLKATNAVKRMEK